MAPLAPSYGITIAANSFITNPTSWYFQPISWSNIENPYSPTTFNDWNWVSGDTFQCPADGWYAYSIWLQFTIPAPVFNFGVRVNGELAFGGGPGGIGLTGIPEAGSANMMTSVSYFNVNDTVTFGICSNLANSSLGITGDNPIYLQMQNIQGGAGVQGPEGPPNGPTGAQGGVGLQGNQGVIGFQGLQGYGDTGLQGAAGVQGNQGAIGLQGFQGLQGIQGSEGIQGFQGVQGVQGASAPISPSYSLTLSSSSFTSNSLEFYYSPLEWTSVESPYSSTSFNDWNWVSGATLTCPSSGWYAYTVSLQYTVDDPVFSFGINVNGKIMNSGSSSPVGITGITGAGSCNTLSGIAYFDVSDTITFGISAAEINATLGIDALNQVYLQISSIQSYGGATGMLEGVAGAQGLQGNVGLQGSIANISYDKVVSSSSSLNTTTSFATYLTTNSLISGTWFISWTGTYSMSFNTANIIFQFFQNSTGTYITDTLTTYSPYISSIDNIFSTSIQTTITLTSTDTVSVRWRGDTGGEDYVILQGTIISIRLS
jgi:hypothetical protein